MGKTTNQDQTTIRRQELGRELQTFRKKAGLTLEEAARRINCSQSKLCRIERGQRPATIDEVSGLLGLYGVEGQQRDDLLELAPHCSERGWLQRGRPGPRERRSTFIVLESRAESIVDFELAMMPGLLQTGEYIHAQTVESKLVPADEVDELVLTRLRRQSILNRRCPPNFLALIDEPALRRPVGGPEVLRRQLEHLMTMSEYPDITVRVVPNGGYHVGVLGAFQLLEPAEGHPVVYIENLASSLFLEEPHEIDLYRQAQHILLDAALDERESRVLIANVAMDLGTGASTSDADQREQAGLV